MLTLKVTTNWGQTIQFKDAREGYLVNLALQFTDAQSRQMVDEHGFEVVVEALLPANLRKQAS